MNIREKVEAAIRATTFHSRMSYSWFGKLSPQLPSSVRRALTSSLQRQCLIYNLQSQLYRDFYCHGFPVPAAPEEAERQNLGAPSFVRTLSDANSGKGYYSEGWDVHGVHGGKVVLRRAGLRISADLRDCLVPKGRLVEVGMRVGLRFPKELLRISPGFYVALGDKELVDDSPSPLVRFYWNLSPEGSVQFMRKATLALNRAELPFKIKTVDDPTRFTRCDAVVLYIRKADYKAVSKSMGRVYSQIAGSLKNAEPAFTKRLAMGIGLAEDPGQGESFGSHRCNLLAEGLVRSYEEGKKSVQGQLQVIKKCFDENGIDLDRPFVSSATVDEYEFSTRLQIGQRLAEIPATELDTGALLDAASEIGQHLARAAVWYEGCCNWMGVSTGWPESELPTKEYCALGPGIYSGSSGVALFLSQLHLATGDSEARRCALGAINHALSRFDAVKPQAFWGLLVGGMGIALVAACVGKALHERKLLECAARVLKNFSLSNQLQCEFDFTFGNAGAITALLRSRDLLRDDSLLERAVELGEDLLRSAEKSAIGYSWRSPRARGARNLTGFAHGTAGAGFALMELFQATGKSRYRDGADQAFEYERHWFDMEVQNWPDFREDLVENKRSKKPQRFSTAWCHGAPGIALSRLRAYEILKDPKYKEGAVTALQTTDRMTKAWLQSGTLNYSLCHGICGNAEILLYGSRVLGEEFAEGTTNAFTVARALLANATKVGHAAHRKMELGEGPGLMLGEAGLGYFYLRLKHPPILSVLSMALEG